VRAIYNILFTFLFMLSSPYYFLRMRRRGNWRTGIGQRFGYYSAKFKQAITNRHVLWMHAEHLWLHGLATAAREEQPPRKD
jgi:3-deoxy-D-manno-octulosonic-acid transferase